jgi:hypothetical protein
MLRVIHERIPLREWLGHMSLFHANVQIRNDSAHTLYIPKVLVTFVDNNEEEEEESLPADRRSGAALVPPHTLVPGYSHLYSIPPPHQQHARITLAFRGDNDSPVCELLFRSGDRLRVAS